MLCLKYSTWGPVIINTVSKIDIINTVLPLHRLLFQISKTSEIIFQNCKSVADIQKKLNIFNVFNLIVFNLLHTLVKSSLQAR